MELYEVTREIELVEVFRRCERQIPAVFRAEPMDSGRFCAIFGGGAAHLYEVTESGRALGVVFFAAENRFSVRFGVISYHSEGMRRVREAFALCASRLAERGVRVIVAEVAADNYRSAAAARFCGMKECGRIAHYYGDVDMILFHYNMEVQHHG